MFCDVEGPCEGRGTSHCGNHCDKIGAAVLVLVLVLEVPFCVGGARFVGGCCRRSRGCGKVHSFYKKLLCAYAYQPTTRCRRPSSSGMATRLPLCLCSGFTSAPFGSMAKDQRYCHCARAPLLPQAGAGAGAVACCLLRWLLFIRALLMLSNKS
jgi:hypothetical protein